MVVFAELWRIFLPIPCRQLSANSKNGEHRGMRIHGEHRRMQIEQTRRAPEGKQCGTADKGRCCWSEVPSRELRVLLVVQTSQPLGVQHTAAVGARKPRVVVVVGWFLSVPAPRFPLLNPKEPAGQCPLVREPADPRLPLQGRQA